MLFSFNFIFCVALILVFETKVIGSYKLRNLRTIKMIEGGRNLFINIDGNQICYDYFKAQDPSAAPPILYLPGLNRLINELSYHSIL
jgi:hypothetical protein